MIVLLHAFVWFHILIILLLQTSQPHPHRGIRKMPQLPKEVEAIEDDKQGTPDDVSSTTLWSER